METLTTVAETPHNLIALAIEKGLDTTALKELMDLKERHDAGIARKAFFEAFTNFQANCPDIRKGKAVEFNTTKYHYAPLADITRQIGKTLKENELSYRWEIQDNAAEIKVTCLVSHILGHTERTTMQANPDTSGATQVRMHHKYTWRCPECENLSEWRSGTKIIFIKWLLKEEVREINGIFICNWCASKHENNGK